MQDRLQYLRKNGLACMLLVLFVLASCSPNVFPEIAEPTSTQIQVNTLVHTATPAPKTPTATSTPILAAMDVDPDELAGVIVRFAHPWVGEKAEMLERLAREFTKTNPWGIHVQAYPHGGETALVNSVMQLPDDDLPTVIAVPAYLRSELMNGKPAVNLHAYFNHPDWGFSLEEREDFTPVFLTSFDAEDQVSTLPFAPQATVLFYNRSWGQALGFPEAPHDLDAFRTQNCEATFTNWQDAAKGGTGGWVINLDARVLVSWYYAFGGTFSKGEEPLFNNLAGRDAFGYLWEIKNQGCIWFALNPNHQAYFADRLALLYAGQLDQIPTQMGWMETAGNEDDWTVIGFPGPAGEQILVEGPELFIMAGAPENELAAWLFIKYLLAPEAQAKLVESLFTLPVRESALELLTKFKTDYPQWEQGTALVDTANVLPVSEAWGLAQWPLQDAANRILQDENGDVSSYLAQLDALILDLIDSSQ
ncbi:MAG: extracellular solute-binding protein [Chloroflexi bacterium]|nr:extracellular solute-binding protein [Chloroflexota bacterium]